MLSFPKMSYTMESIMDGLVVKDFSLSKIATRGGALADGLSRTGPQRRPKLNLPPAAGLSRTGSCKWARGAARN